jgi:hypothetical protein
VTSQELNPFPQDGDGAGHEPDAEQPRRNGDLAELAPGHVLLAHTWP